MLQWLRDIWPRLKRGLYTVSQVFTVERPDEADAGIWPPIAHRDRLNWYHAGYQLFKGRHEQVFEPDRRATARPYVTINELGAGTRLVVRRLFGEPATFEAVADETQDTTDVQDAQQELLEFLASDNRLAQLNQKQAQTASYCGEAVYKVRYDAAEDRVVIEGVNPSLYFPITAPDDETVIQAVSLEWIVRPRGTRGEWLRKEIHEPGLVRNELWELKETSGRGREWRVVKQVALNSVEAFAEVPEVTPTGVDALLLVQVPNMEVAEDGIWGTSDYENAFDAQRELNNRVTRLAALFDLHASPRMHGAKHYLDEQGTFVSDEMEFIIVREGEEPPNYLVPDLGNADLVKQFTDDLRLDVFRAMNLSPESAGLGQQDAGGAESGRAIIRRQMETTSTVQAKGALFDEGLRKTLSLATKLWDAQVRDKGDRAGATTLEPHDIEVKRGDGMPEDEMEDATLFETLMRPTALKPEVAASMAFGWSEEEALEKVKEPPPAAPGGGLPFTPLAQRAAALQQRRAELVGQQPGQQPAPAEVVAGGPESK